MSTLALNVLYPLAERLINAAFVAAAPAGLVALGVAAWAALNGMPGPALAALGAGVLCAIAVRARWWSPWRLTVRRLKVPNLPMRVVYFSDLHVNRRKAARWVSRVVQAVAAEKPDVIVFGGDFWGHPRGLQLADLLAPLRELRAPHGVHTIFGNHDRGLHDRDHQRRPAELEALLPSLGIQRLHNTAIDLPGGLRIIGVGELWTGECDVAAAFAAGDGTPVCTLFFGHNPDIMDLPDMQPQRADLFVFGHTHHGQIHLPFWPSLGVPIAGNLWRGEHRRPQGRVYVGAGCGEAALPVRIGTRPEIVVLE